jgi:retron-type reverse transcriptase
MSRLTKLKTATSLNDVADLFGYKPKAVSYILYKLPAAQKYTTFSIPKKNGGQRTINAPAPQLKSLQRKLADLLQDCLDEINAERKLKDRTAHGFKRKRSIITNARQHRNRRWVFNIDLNDFFPSINFGRVRGFFIKNRDFGLHEKVATTLAQIACRDNSLPQGSPCSPVISNLVFHFLDMRLVKLAKSAGCTYSRYADDLTFSTNKKQFPPEIARSVGDHGAESHLWQPGDALRNTIEQAGFNINANKEHLMYRTSRQVVTGLVVNKKISVRWEYRQHARAMVNKLITTGAFEINGVVHKDGNITVEKRPGTLNELHGLLGFIDGIDVYNNCIHRDDKRTGFSSRELVYREFLIYSIFYAAQMPVILCEGDTDNVYLTHAIRSLAAEFPDLAEVTETGKIRLKVRLYKYPKSSTARLLGLTEGGSSVLPNFMATYNKETSRFKAPGLEHPVIIFYDNDDGAKKIQNVIKQISKAQPTGTEPFVHVIKNMYAVPTTIPANGMASKIEDFFGDEIKATVIDGKTFNTANNFDVDKHYGKRVFAHKVVRPKAETIDFTGFRPLLTSIVAVISHHKTIFTLPPPEP